MEKEYQVYVNYSWTVDFVSWDCPRCGHHNEFSSWDDDDICEACDLQLQGYVSPLGDCDNDTIFCSWEEEEETED